MDSSRSLTKMERKKERIFIIKKNVENLREELGSRRGREGEEGHVACTEKRKNVNSGK